MSNPPVTDNLITVLGSTGTTGKRVAHRLQERGHRLRGVSRRTAPRFHWTEPTTWPEVLDGTRALYIVPPEPPVAVDSFVTAAIAAGVERMVLLSARGPDQAGDPHLLEIEDAITTHAPSWTVIRPSWFAQNFSEGFFRPALDAGPLRLPTGTGREPFVHVDDIADVAVAAITEDGHNGHTYELSGPEALSFGDAVGQLATATGEPLQFEPVEPEVFAAEQAQIGMPEPVIDMLVTLFTAIRNGANDYLSSGVEEALGRPATPFSTFATRAAADWGKIRTR